MCACHAAHDKDRVNGFRGRKIGNGMPRICRCDRELPSPLGAYWSVYEFNPPSARLEAVRLVEGALDGMPRICWYTIFICGKPLRCDKPLKQLGLLSRQADIRRVTGTGSIDFRMR